ETRREKQDGRSILPQRAHERLRQLGVGDVGDDEHELRLPCLCGRRYLVARLAQPALEQWADERVLLQNQHITFWIHVFPVLMNRLSNRPWTPRMWRLGERIWQLP